MTKPDKTRVKVRVSVAGHRPGDVVDLNTGYAENLIKVGYATRVDNLADALSAEPTKYGDWQQDPRSSDDGSEDEDVDLSAADGLLADEGS